MTRNLRKTFFTLILFYISYSLSFANEVATFYRYSSKDGLSCNYVHSISQDDHGFLWIATEYGLNRFDGVHFRSYYAEEYPSLFRNQLSTVHHGTNGKVLVAGNNGLVVCYDEEDEDFNNLMPDDFDRTYYKSVTGFYDDSQGREWMTTSNGLYRYDASLGKFSEVPAVTDSTAFTFVSKLVIDPFGRFLCGNYTGLLVFDSLGNHQVQYDEMLRFNHIISNIVQMDDLHYIVCSYVGSFWMIEMLADGTILPPKEMKAPFNNITTILKDSKENYWFGTAGSGLWRARYENGAFSYESVEPQNSKSEELNKIHCIFEDRDGDLWIGTQNVGLLRYSVSRNSGSVHSSDVGFPVVDGTTFAEDAEHNILVGADGHGIFLFSSDFQVLHNYTMEDGLSCNNILSIKNDMAGNLWIAGWGGAVCKMDARTHKIEKMSYDFSYPQYTNKSVLPTSDGEVWVVTAGDGTYVRDTKGHWSRKVLMDSTITSPDIWMDDVCQSSAGVRWVITSRTIWRCDSSGYSSVYPDQNQFQLHAPLIMNQGVCDPEGNLLVVSNKGVFRISSDGQTYEWLDFMPAGEYSSIVRDKSGMFWTGGSNGILSFDVETKTYQKVLLDNRFKNRNYFTVRAAYEDSRGNLYFGSSEGFVMVDPNRLNAVNEISYLSFSQLRVRGEAKPVGCELLPTRLPDLPELKLRYDETNIEVTIDVIDFSGLNNVELHYRVKGLDKDWIPLNDQRDVKISHIPTGNYVLEVSASRRGTSLSKVITLPISVSPPWWKSWWFLSLLALSSLCLIFAIVYYRFRSVVRQREILREMVKERTKELNETNVLLKQKQEVIKQRNDELESALTEKNRLLSVIAHDLKSPMAGIVGALDSVLKSQQPIEGSRSTLKDIYLSAFNLQSAMVKLLEWARGKNEELATNVKSESLRTSVQEVVELLSGLFSEKQIHVSVAFEHTHQVMADARMVGTAIRNVLSNAIKYTYENGNISVSTKEENGRILLSIADDGMGMGQERVDAIMSNDNVISTQGTKLEKGTGLGFRMAKDYISRCGGRLWVESKEGRGTTVRIELPCALEEELTDLRNPVVDEIPLELNEDLLAGNTVMIVDDDPLILLHLRTLLEPYFQLIEASNGKDGYAKALECHPDIVLSDVEMPECNGIEMYQHFKENEETAHIPLLFLSARNSETDRLFGLNSGAIDYIAKPFSGKELLAKLTNILTLRRTRQQQILEDSIVKKETPEDTNPLLKKILSIIEQKYSDASYSASDMADELAMSRSTLARKLKSITDKTPLDLLTDYRMRKARELLRNSAKSVTEVAYAVGFNDPLYFSKKYKTYFGLNPSLEGSN